MLEWSVSPLRTPSISTPSNQGNGREKKGGLFPSAPPTPAAGLSLAAWAQDCRHLLIPSAPARVYPVPLCTGLESPGGGAHVCRGRGVGPDYAKASIWTVFFSPVKNPSMWEVEGEWREILIYRSVMFIFTLGWFRAFVLMYQGHHFIGFKDACKFCVCGGGQLFLILFFLKFALNFFTLNLPHKSSYLK